MTNPSPWQPTRIRRVERTMDTGSEVVAVVTDAGRGFAKLLGNREGPHVLASEFVGTLLASALGLPTFDYAVIHYDGSPAITFPSNGVAVAGSAWLTHTEEGFPWSGLTEDLRKLSNPELLVRLVLLDQWTRNCDRYRPRPLLRRNLRNVFFSRQGTPEGKLRLVAMDHTHCFTCGAPLTPAIARIDNVQDPSQYGLFPEFLPMLQRGEAVVATEALLSVPDAAIHGIVDAIPTDWEVNTPIRRALSEYLIRRREWLAEHFVHGLFPQDELFL